MIADGTRRLLGEVFELRARPAAAQGLRPAGGGFQVAGERPAESRFEARQPGRPPPMVGRDQELALVLERWRQAAAGEGQAVLLVGEAGIGKSRLVQALLDALAGESTRAAPLPVLAPPHRHGALAGDPAARLAAGLEPADAEAARLDKLEALLRQAPDDVGEAAPLVAALLGIEAGDRYPAAGPHPAAARARTLAALVEQLSGWRAAGRC